MAESPSSGTSRPPVFIGGTGRSGTSILYDVLGSHPQLHGLRRETRFLIDPGGLHDLVDALSDRYTISGAGDALARFERLMTVDLVTPWTSPYPGFAFGRWFGEDHYWRTLRSFLGKLVDVEFEGWDWVQPGGRTRLDGARASYWKLRHRLVQRGRATRTGRKLLRLRSGRRSAGNRATDRNPRAPRPPGITLPDEHRGIIVPRYFRSRSTLTAEAATFVDELFRKPTEQSGKEIWVEKTPHNLLHLPFLWELFPRALFIHVTRDPRAVTHSLTGVPWAPSDAAHAARYLRLLYERWLDVRESIPENEPRLLEVRLEDLCRDPTPFLRKLASRLGIKAEFPAAAELSTERSERWRERMPASSQKRVIEILGDLKSELGYAL